MTAISFSAPAEVSRTTRLRVTARGRRVLATLAATPVVIALAVAIVSGGSALAARDGSASGTPFATVTVSHGDTLWSIAEEVAPTDDPRDVVDSISRLNTLSGAGLTAGQLLAIPAEYAPAS